MGQTSSFLKNAYLDTETRTDPSGVTTATAPPSSARHTVVPSSHCVTNDHALIYTSPGFGLSGRLWRMRGRYHRCRS